MKKRPRKRKIPNPLQIATQLTYRHLTTPTKKEKQMKQERKYKQNGWKDE